MVIKLRKSKTMMLELGNHAHQTLSHQHEVHYSNCNNNTDSYIPYTGIRNSCMVCIHGFLTCCPNTENVMSSTVAKVDLHCLTFATQ